MFANALTRETNAKQMRDRAPKLSDIEVRLKDMDRMGIDIQAVSPAPQQTYYWTEPGQGQELARTVNERLAEIVSQAARSLRRARHRAVAGCLARGQRARACVKTPRLARRRDQPERQWHGPHRSAAGAREILRQGAGARRGDLHAPDRLHPRRAPDRTTISTT